MTLKTIADLEVLKDEIAELGNVSPYVAEQIIPRVLQAADHPLCAAGWFARFQAWLSSLSLESYLRQYPNEELQLRLNAPGIWDAYQERCKAQKNLNDAVKEYQNAPL